MVLLFPSNLEDDLFTRSFCQEHVYKDRWEDVPNGSFNYLIDFIFLMEALVI